MVPQACSESELQAAIQYGYTTCKTIGITLDTTAIPTGATAFVLLQPCNCGTSISDTSIPFADPEQPAVDPAPALVQSAKAP